MPLKPELIQDLLEWTPTPSLIKFRRALYGDGQIDDGTLLEMRKLLTTNDDPNGDIVDNILALLQKAPEGISANEVDQIVAAIDAVVLATIATRIGLNDALMPSDMAARIRVEVLRSQGVNGTYTTGTNHATGDYRIEFPI